jgi:hypothetical protein
MAEVRNLTRFNDTTALLMSRVLNECRLFASGRSQSNGFAVQAMLTEELSFVDMNLCQVEDEVATVATLPFWPRAQVLRCEIARLEHGVGGVHADARIKNCFSVLGRTISARSAATLCSDWEHRPSPLPTEFFKKCCRKCEPKRDSFFGNPSNRRRVVFHQLQSLRSGYEITDFVVNLRRIINCERHFAPEQVTKISTQPRHRSPHG